MKANNRQGNNSPQHQNTSHKRIPQNKDDLDSRKVEEQDTKGDDVTHNKSEHRSEKKNRPHRQ